MKIKDSFVVFGERVCCVSSSCEVEGVGETWSTWSPECKLADKLGAFVVPFRTPDEFRGEE